MNRTRITASVALGAALYSTGALADGPLYGAQGNAYYAYAKVVDVEPIVRVVRVSSPERRCCDEEVTHYAPAPREPGSYTPMILGGIVGGLVGNQFGSGRGNTALTAAGALLGASVGRDRAFPRGVGRRHAAIERRCQVTEAFREEERVDGYRVTYSYQGRSFVTRMDHDPGPEMQVRVSVAPVD